MRWRETVEWFAANNVTTLYEIGAGKVLTGLARRIDKSVNGIAVNSTADIDTRARWPASADTEIKERGNHMLRFDRPQGPGNRFFRWHRRRDRKAAAQAGRHRRPAWHARREARGSGRRTWRPRQDLPANLSNRDEVKALGVKAEEELGGVDILVNNAGITKDGLFVRMSDEDWDSVWKSTSPPFSG